jgi:hypothetical protein
VVVVCIGVIFEVVGDRPKNVLSVRIRPNVVSKSKFTACVKGPAHAAAAKLKLLGLATAQVGAGGFLAVVFGDEESRISIERQHTGKSSAA